MDESGGYQDAGAEVLTEEDDIVGATALGSAAGGEKGESA